MKKILFVAILLALVLTACGSKEDVDNPGYSYEYQEACYDIGGFMGRDGCVIQQQVVDAPKSDVISESVAENPVQAPASDCIKRAEELGAPADMVSAICDALPSGNGVSQRLPVGTQVAIGSITFDNEDRVWFLQDFTTPAMANYAFSYEGSEQSLFDAPFATGTELGYGKDGTRVPFTICWDVTSEGCIPPADLFPTN